MIRKCNECGAKNRVPAAKLASRGKCGPCRMAAPEVKRVAEEMAGKAIVLKVDTESNPDLASQYKIQSIPNFMVLKDGKQVLQKAGLVKHTQMRRWLEDAS